MNLVRNILSAFARSWLGRARSRWWKWPPVGWVRFGSMRRLTPISRRWGLDRGSAIDRYYIEKFLTRHAEDICGRVLEIGENTYTYKFGGERVSHSDVLDVEKGNAKATIVADLACADHIPSDTFNCIILTQTLQLIYDVKAALIHLNRILKEEGVLLASFPGISKTPRQDMERWGWYWQFTTLSARRLLEEIFPSENVEVQASGNVLTAISFLHGVAAQELRPEELDFHDPDYEMLITVRAVKPKEE